MITTWVEHFQQYIKEELELLETTTISSTIESKINLYDYLDYPMNWLLFTLNTAYLFNKPPKYSHFTRITQDQ